MYETTVELSDKLKDHHAQAWQQIASAGDFFTGAERIAIVRSAREALQCQLCGDRKTALSPNSVSGEHDDASGLDPAIVDFIHRLRTDPGRLTKTVFAALTRTISEQAYVEIVSVVASSVIIDTLHNALGLGVPQLPQAIPGKPSGSFNAEAVDAGAWVLILAAPSDMADTGLPRVPNIARSLGLVPSALELFFLTFRPHYALKDIDLSISQSQAEFVAARVSAMNECFY